MAEAIIMITWANLVTCGGGGDCVRKGMFDLAKKSAKSNMRSCPAVKIREAESREVLYNSLFF